jgi:hypothetical protein
MGQSQDGHGLGQGLSWLVAFGALFMAGVATPGWTQTLQAFVSSDISIDLATPVEDQQLSDNTGQLVSILEPDAAVDLVGFHRAPGTGVDYFVYDTAVDLQGFQVGQGWAIQHDGTQYSMALSATALGAAPGVEFDALSFDGELPLVSFNVTTEIGGIVVDDEDVLRLGGAQPELLFDGSAVGIPSSLDVDAVHYLVAEVGRLLLLSFDGHGKIAGVDFSDEDVVAFNLDNFTWAPWFTGNLIDVDWGAASIDAVTVVIPIDEGVIFTDGFESGDVQAWSSVTP